LSQRLSRYSRQAQQPTHGERLPTLVGRHGHAWSEVCVFAKTLGLSLPSNPTEFLRSGERFSIDQVWAISEATDTRFLDWLEFFGYRLHEIPRLQQELHEERTHPCPNNLAQLEYAAHPFPVAVDDAVSLKRTAFFTEAFKEFRLISLSSIWTHSKHHFSYGSVGKFDGSMIPLLWPGDLFRYDSRVTDPRSIGWRDETSQPIWCVEHNKGTSCGWIYPQTEGILLRPYDLEYPSFRFRVSEYRILGLVDASLHVLGSPMEASPSALTSLMRKSPQLPVDDASAKSAGGYLLQRRLRCNLSLRDIEQLSGFVVRKRGDENYRLNKSSSGELERDQGRPYWIETYISLAVVCLLELEELFRRYGFLDREAGKRALFRERIIEPERVSQITFGLTVPLRASSFFARLLDIWQELPVHMLPLFPEWRAADVAILGSDDNLLGSFARTGALLLIDRKRRTRGKWRWGNPLEQSLELIDSREGLLCGVVVESNGTISVHPLAGSSQPTQHFDRRAVDRLGRVIAIATKR
jgi:hypothetical protein